MEKKNVFFKDIFFNLNNFKCFIRLSLYDLYNMVNLQNNTRDIMHRIHQRKFGDDSLDFV